ncbi:TPA: hypothetical protein R6E27_000311 [Campylobacter jejuni]|nr:hypothetical protein [Campylobacter jejuni]
MNKNFVESNIPSCSKKSRIKALFAPDATPISKIFLGLYFFIISKTNWKTLKNILRHQA